MINEDWGFGDEFPPKLDRAIEFATAMHKGQSWDNGRPYVEHPIRVAFILTNVTHDVDVLCAAVLHDTLEDTDTTYGELKSIFGEKVANLVSAVTHEGIKDMGYCFPRLIPTVGLQTAIMIKFADRLDNLSHMEPWDDERKEAYLRKSRFWNLRAGEKREELE